MRKTIITSVRVFIFFSIVFSLLGTPTPAYASTYNVNSTNDVDDGTCNATHCSLREAIIAANNDGGGDTIRFDSLPAGSIIVLNDVLPPITDNATRIRADLHPAYSGSPVIGVDGANAAASMNPLSGSLFQVQSSDVQIRGLAIFNFEVASGFYLHAAIWVFGPGVNNTLIQDNYIGTDLTGTVPAGNHYGVRVEEATGTAIQDNLIGNSFVDGITLVGVGTTNTTIQGNTIGMDVTGTAVMSNENGIRILPGDALSIGPSNNTIHNNLISGNATGMILSNASQNVIQDNLIGTDFSGSAAIGNTAAGIALFGTSDNNQILNNTISASGYAGILIEGASNVVQGNYIGTDSAGTSALGNLWGVLIDSSIGGNLIGGLGSGEGNVLSGSSQEGVRVYGASAFVNEVLGNMIGTDINGSYAVPNMSGVAIFYGGNAQVLDNVISGNSSYGIYVDNTGGGTIIQGNLIGTDASGTSAISNGNEGIVVGANGAQGLVIGGPNPGEGNVISGNGLNGILLVGSDHVVQGNFIGTDITGTNALPNAGAGISIFPSTISNWPLDNILIGGATPEEGNVISGNADFGIYMYGGSDLATNTTIQNNFIGTDISGSGPLPNGQGGISLRAVEDTLIGGMNGENVIAYNGGPGILFPSPIAVSVEIGNTISRNSIYMNDDLGIDLVGDGVTANDPGDGDIGPNLLLNFPEFSSVSITQVQGTACNGCVVEIFAVDEDPSGHGEGITFLTDTVAAGGSFSADVSTYGLAICDKVTATATDSDGNTSEFSQNGTVGTCLTYSPPIILILILTPGLVGGLWVYTRTKNKPKGVGGFLAGLVFGGALVYTIGRPINRVPETAFSRTPYPTATLRLVVPIEDVEEDKPGPIITPGGVDQPAGAVSSPAGCEEIIGIGFQGPTQMLVSIRCPGIEQTEDEYDADVNGKDYKCIKDVKYPDVLFCFGPKFDTGVLANVTVYRSNGEVFFADSLPVPENIIPTPTPKPGDSGADVTPTKPGPKPTKGS